MKQVNILSVCGSGTVTSSMVAGKLKEKLKENNIIATTTEARPTEALNLVKSGRFDLIVHTSPLPDGDYGLPTINAFACLIGIGEADFFDEVINTINKL
jgi:PTS system galactitol-specific IIB component